MILNRLVVRRDPSLWVWGKELASVVWGSSQVIPCSTCKPQCLFRKPLAQILDADGGPLWLLQFAHSAPDISELTSEALREDDTSLPQLCFRETDTWIRFPVFFPILLPFLFLQLYLSKFISCSRRAFLLFLGKINSTTSFLPNLWLVKAPLW